MTLHIIATGGTFEKHYDEMTGELVFRESHLPAILKRGRVSVPYTFEQVCLMDSLAMQDQHRLDILAACRKAAAGRIVIVHGTDTMRETAALIGRETLDKTVVLTGAMIPYEFDHSDALFNIGFAIGAVQLLPQGVYVLMNGRVFEWNKVRKNRREGMFEEVR